MACNTYYLLTIFLNILYEAITFAFLELTAILCWCQQ